MTTKNANAEKAAFIRDMKKRQKELAEAAKKEAASSFITDEELIENLGLDETKKQFHCKLTRVRYGYDKHESQYYAFNYVIAAGEHESTPISQFFGMGGKTREERLKKDARITATFQRLNIDTTKWPAEKVAEKLVEAADKLTVSKPEITLALYTWGDNPDEPRLGVDIVGVRTSKPSKQDDEESQYEEVDEEVEESEEAEEAEEEVDYASYVGYEASFDTGDGSVTVAATEYDEGTGLFTVEDENGELYEASFEDLDFGE